MAAAAAQCLRLNPEAEPPRGATLPKSFPGHSSLWRRAEGGSQAPGLLALVCWWVGGRARYWLLDQTSPPLRGRCEGLEPGGRK